MATTLKRKLSTKTIMGGRIPAPEVKTFLYRIAGRVTGVKTGTSDFGPWLAFKGNFQAQREDGEIFAAPLAFVPEPVQSMLEDAVQKQLADGLVPSIQFGIDLFAVPDKAAAVGYTFDVAPILKPEDETDSLLANLNATHALPHLAADEPEPEKSAKPPRSRK